MADIKENTQVGAWIIEKALGKGGMGAVFLCRNSLDEAEKVALKVLLRGSDAELRQRFIRETRILRRLNHHAIIPILSTGVDPHHDLHYFTMPFVDGQPLKARIKQGPMPEEEGLGLLRQLVSGLQHAHRAGVAHRDIKPDNIIRRDDGRICIIDFGIAKPRGWETITQLDRGFRGTIDYLPPECLAREQIPEPTAWDIYATGQVFCELLTGRFVPIKDKISGPLDIGPSYSPQLRALIRKATAPDPSARISSMDELQLLLDQIRSPEQQRITEEKQRKVEEFALLLSRAEALDIPIWKNNEAPDDEDITRLRAAIRKQEERAQSLHNSTTTLLSSQPPLLSYYLPSRFTSGRITRKGDYIHGSFVNPESVDGYINGVNPGNRLDIIGRFTFSESNADEAINYARIGHRTWKRIPLHDRLRAIQKMQSRLSGEINSLSNLITREIGKPLWEARQEIAATIRELDVLLRYGERSLSSKTIPEIGARQNQQPFGVVGIITPYNMPVLWNVQPVAAAIISGNAIVHKGSKFCPALNQEIAVLWDQVRIPRGVYNLIQGPGSVIGARIICSPDIDALYFAGSINTAETINRLTAERPELPKFMNTGGKGTAIVLNDADLDRAVYEVLVGAFLTTGQRHNSTARVLVTDAIFDRFVSALSERTLRLRINYGFARNVFMGPLISEHLRSRYRRYCRRLSSAGHHPICESGRVTLEGRRGFYARPALYQVHWNNASPMLDAPPPGPILLVYRVSNWEEAAALHNQIPHRGATSLFTQTSNPVVDEMQNRLRTGTLNINRGTIASSPWLSSVGLGRASNGSPSGFELMRVMSASQIQIVEDRPIHPSQTSLPGLNW